MRKQGVALMLVLIMISAISSYVSASEGVKWFNLKEGMEKAKAEKKPMIVDFYYGKGCPSCEFLQREIYDNPPIAKRIMDEFVPIKVDLTKPLSAEEEKLGDKYEFKKDCLLLFLDHNGELIKDQSGKKLRFPDKIYPEEFVQYMDMIKARNGGK
jgi:thioredoxin-related protein